MTQAPPALVQLTRDFEARTDRPKSYQLGGIVGDAKHMNPPEGYHVAYDDQPHNWGGYSLHTARDQAGAKAHPTYASAWDLSMDTADMTLVTIRLINAAKAKDPRLGSVAELAGTTNGTTVHAFYVNTGQDDPNNTGGWDPSHCHHVHLSISRDDCDNYAALAPILDVICGVPLTPKDWFDMATPEELKAIVADAVKTETAALVKRINELDTKIQYGDATHPQGLQHIGRKVDAGLTALHVDPASVK